MAQTQIQTHETQTQTQTQISQTKPRPKIKTISIEVVNIPKSMYNVVRSIVNSSIDTIRCYVLDEKWWCEKRTIGGLPWKLMPTTYPVTTVIAKEGQYIEVPVKASAVVIETPKGSIYIVEPGYRHKVAVDIEGVGTFKDEDLDKVAVIADVPFAYPIRLVDLVNAIDSIVDWG